MTITFVVPAGTVTLPFDSLIVKGVALSDLRSPFELSEASEEDEVAGSEEPLEVVVLFMQPVRATEAMARAAAAGRKDLRDMLFPFRYKCR